MSQVRRSHRLPPFLGTLLLGLLGAPQLSAQGYDDAFELKSKLKLEVPYADYGEYEYPEPILFQYGISPYQQNQPYLVNFPERRALVKFSHLTDERTALSVKYQFADIKEGVQQHLLEGKLTRALSEELTGIVSLSGIRDTRGFSSVGGGLGTGWELSPLTSLRGDAQIFYRGPEAAALGGRATTLSTRFQVRQVLTVSTAIQAEYVFYNATGDAVEFRSHTGTILLSQWLPTRTAVHLSFRQYNSTLGITSTAPALEIAQYIDWATVLWLKFRYYRNSSGNVGLGEQGVIVPEGLISRSFSAQLNHEFSDAVLVYAKYRYYNSNLHVQMNTYMLGAVYAF